MKKIFLLAASAFLACSAINAQDLDGVRIYLNPGHGSWGPNDRPMATIPYPNLVETGRPDTCGFYESNTNLWKCLKLGNKLESWGAYVLYSRVKNGPFPYVADAPDEELYNRSLSEICEEVEANNMDMFLSVHSNAASEGTNTNYPLFLYRGTDGEGGDRAAGSWEMASTMWPLFYTNEIDPHTYYSPTNPNLRGDVSFYGSESGRTDPTTGVTYSGYLGVLKHGAPGFLSEGYFHTYQPARHRALNPDYCGQEGIRYARGIAAYFEAGEESIGYIMGTVKDLHERIDNPLFNYNPGTNDQWLPINGAVVTLYKGGEQVATYTVDNNYNGVFVFENLEPGDDYTLDITAEGYKPLFDEYKQPITVTANATTYPMVYMEAEGYEPPAVIYENYPNPLQDSYLGVAGTYNMNQVYANQAVSELEGKTVRRSIVRGDTVYTLAIDAENNPYIYLLKASDHSLISQVSTTGVQGQMFPISDIALTADTVLIACNKEETQFDDSYVAAGMQRGTLRVYKWTADENNTPIGDPQEWFTSQLSGNFYNANTGQTLAVSGESNECTIVTTAETTGSSKQVRLLIFSVSGGNMLASMRNQDATNITALVIGDDYSLMVSPRDDNSFIIDGSLSNPTEYQLASDGQAPTNMGTLSTDIANVAANGANYFKYAQHSMMAIPVVDDGNNAGVALYDITDGLGNARLVKTTGTELDAQAATYAMAAGTVDNADITLLLNKDNTLSLFSTEGAEQPKIKAIMAYDLAVTPMEDNGGYTFSFVSNEDATSGEIVFYDSESGEEIGTYPLSGIVEGENTVDLINDELPGEVGQVMTWAVALEGEAIGTITNLNEYSEYAYNAAYLAIDKSPESEHFGQVYVADRAGTANTPQHGIYVYDPTWTRMNETPYQGGAGFISNYRMGIDETGKLYIPEWSDPNSGVFVADPSNLDGQFTQFFEGERTSSGLFTNNGVEVGGSSTCATVFGTGENARLYVHSEDQSYNGSTNNIAIYNIGSSDGLASTWGEAPSAFIGIGGLLINGNVNVVVTDENGVWASQVRSNGNNTSGVPSLIYAKNDGTVLFNSGSNDFAPYLNGSGGGGFAISNDGSMLVINDASSTFQFYDVTWDGETPTLTPKYSYKHSINNSGGNTYQLAFDYAGNLLATGGYFGVFSIPTDDNSTVVPAKKAMTVIKGESGVANNVVNVAAAKIYPNPTTGIINIETTENIVSIKVYNTTGALVLESSETTIDLGDLASGLYFVKVNDMESVKIIKK